MQTPNRTRTRTDAKLDSDGYRHDLDAGHEDVWTGISVGNANGNLACEEVEGAREEEEEGQEQEQEQDQDGEKEGEKGDDKDEL